ncbi:MAG: hypothetical protein OXC30_06760 [Alphaproteobacteria bacterium]|nr:hypothetical protein [Alphaproteobacteria bacterium]
MMWHKIHLLRSVWMRQTLGRFFVYGFWWCRRSSVNILRHIVVVLKSVWYNVWWAGIIGG